jgi:hypothetical protein
MKAAHSLDIVWRKLARPKRGACKETHGATEGKAIERRELE